MSNQLLLNNEFSAGLNSWTNESSASGIVDIELVNGNPRARLQPTDVGTARISQQVAVEGNTQYQLIGNLYSEGDSYGFIGVKGFDDKWSQETSGDQVTGEYRIIFTTSAETEYVNIFAEAYKQQIDPVAVDNLRLVKLNDGDLADSTGDSSANVNENPVADEGTNQSPPLASVNMVLNPNFIDNLSQWNNESNQTATADVELIDGNYKAVLQPTVDGTARISQQIAVTGNTAYKLSATMISEEESYGYLGVNGYDGQWSQQTSGDNESGNYSIEFTTSDDTEFINVFLEAYKQQSSQVLFGNIVLTPVVNDQPLEPSDDNENDGSDKNPSDLNESDDKPDDIDGHSHNLVKQGQFNSSFSDEWILTGDVDVVEIDENRVLKLEASAGQSARVVQHINGLKPETLYTFSTRVRTNNSWASFGVDQGTQKAKTNAARGDEWQEKRFIFYTASNSSDVRLFLEDYQAEQGEVYFDDVQVVEGRLPLPSDSSDEDWETPPSLPTLVRDGDEMILNQNFNAGLDQWVTDHASWQENGRLILNATQDETARAVQDIPFALAPNTTYTLQARVKATGEGAIIGVTDREELTASVEVNNQEYEDLVLSFTTDDDYRKIRVFLEQYKGSNGELIIDSLSLLAEGGEWLDTPEPIPTRTTDVLFDDFNGPLDPATWLVVDKAWGGDNGGLVPENVELKDGLLLLHAHGDEYTGDVIGHNDRKTRVGSGIATRDYYASGRYEVSANP